MAYQIKWKEMGNQFAINQGGITFSSNLYLVDLLSVTQ
jgi:hypothetical protein